MNKYTRILAFVLILAMSAGIATSEQVVTTKMVSVDGMPAPEQAINFTKLEISPPYINFMLQPGETKELTVTLKNKETTVVSVKPNTILAPYGGYNVYPEWIKITPESAEIPAGGSQKFTIKVSVPVDASIGGSGVQIAFTNETMPSPYPSPFPNYIHVLQVSLDIWTTPKIQIMTPYINDILEAGKEYDYEVKLKNVGTETINIDPKMSSDNNRYYGGPYGQMSAAFKDDAITISAPSNVPAGTTEIVKIHIKVPVDAKGSYNGAINLNIDDPSIQVYDGMVQMNFNVWTQPAEPFERSFKLEEAAPITIEVSSGINYNYPYGGQAIGADRKEPSFETTLDGPAGKADIKATKTLIKGVVNMGGQIPPWELDSKGIYQENGVQLIETYKVSGSPGEWKLKVLPKNTESFEYSILIGE
ncbi:MAG: hypothetical protein O8C61_07395 [Candidatus Methanoperedens sp.]|nr:hypothetical protein [Candidatus Methanoperedens sp.]